MKENKTQEVLKELEEGIKTLFSSNKYKEYLNTMSKFHRYSVNNSMLIYKQNNNATDVAGFASWKNNFNRYVKKGEKGIKILVPVQVKKKVEVTKIDEKTKKPLLVGGKEVKEEKEVSTLHFKIGYVYDVSQTDGEPLPKIAEDLTKDVKNFDILFSSIKNISPYPIEYEKIDSRAKGYCDYTNKRIAIKEGLGQEHIIKTAIHEVAHAKLHCRLDEDKAIDIDRSTREVEAESVAYVVSKKLGIDTSAYSFGYVGAWSEDRELTQLKSSLDRIQKTANELIDNIENELELMKKNRSHELDVSLYDNEIDLDRVREDTKEKPSFRDKVNEAKKVSKEQESSVDRSSKSSRKIENNLEI